MRDDDIHSDSSGNADSGDTSAQHPADPAPELGETQIHDAREAWCETYVHVWADLTRGSFDKKAIELAADEHWQRSPNSNPVMVATMEFTKPEKKAR